MLPILNLPHHKKKYSKFTAISSGIYSGKKNVGNLKGKRRLSPEKKSEPGFWGYIISWHSAVVIAVRI